MGLSIVSIKRSEVEGKTEFEEYKELIEFLLKKPVEMYALGNTYSNSIVEDLSIELENYKHQTRLFELPEKLEKQIPELEKIIAVCKNWDLYFCIY